MVFVVQENPRVNVVPAMRFGEMEVLLAPGDVILNTAPTVSTLKKKLQNFCDDDYLLLLGDPTAIGLATMVAADANQGRVKFLKWDKREQIYFPIQANLYGNQPTTSAIPGKIRSIR